MYKFILRSVATLSAAACLGLGCAGSVPSIGDFENMKRKAGEGESEIVVQRISNLVGGAFRMSVFIDGEERLKLGNEEIGMATVPNGKHSIYAKLGGLKSGVLTVDAESNRTVIYSNVTTGVFLDKLALDRYADGPLDALPSPESSETAPNPNGIGLEEAVKKACSILANKLPDGSKIAVVQVAAEEKDIASLIINEVEFNLVSINRFTIVDRNALDLIRSEQQLQMSGEVSDNEVIRIGSLSGASVVISGAVFKSGDSNRLGLKALDVRTGQIIAMAKGPYQLGNTSGQTTYADKPASTSTAASVPEQTLSPTAQQTQYKQYKQHIQYTTFTAGQRFGTGALNWVLPGVGSAAIMGDWGGAATQWVLVGGGIILMVNGIDTREREVSGYWGGTYTETYEEPNALFHIGYVAVMISYSFNIYRSITFIKKRPQNAAAFENSGLQWAVLPDRDGEVKAYLAYRMEF